MKKPFVTLEQLQAITRQYPTPFHLYDEKGIRDTARALYKAFSWNPGYREFFAVKATPNPQILKILKEEGCGTDCSSLTELMMSDRCGFAGDQIMFSSNDTPAEEFALAAKLGATINLDDISHIEFLKNTDTIVAGGLVRIANGFKIKDGRVSDFSMPPQMIERFQIVEYYRSFLSGRVSWGATNSMLIVSGAFGVFQKQAVIEVGGYKTNTIGEDMEIVVRLHEYMLAHKRRYKIIFCEDSVCWTQGPMSLRDIRSQRRRWQIGLLDTLLAHKRLFLNPRYGSVGLLAIPYNWVFELLGAAVEALGYVIIPFSLVMGELNLFFFTLYFLLAVLLGVILSMGSLILEQYTRRSVMSAKQCLSLSLYAILENFGYRQVITLFRLEGILKYRKLRKTWGNIRRKEVGQ